MRPSRLAVSLALAALAAALPLVISGCPFGTNAGGGQTTLFNVPPTVVLSADVTRGIAPLTVNFSSSGSSDDSVIVSRTWDFGDGATSQEISPSHTFQNTGEYTVKLTLTDDEHASASRTTTIYVTQAPVAVIVVDRDQAPTSPAIFNFDGSQSYDPDGQITQYVWDFDDGSREVIPVVAHTFATPGTYRVRLTVTDNTGVTNSASKVIQVGIPAPRVSFRVPPAGVTNIVVSPDSPLWTAIEFESEPGVPYTLRAGIDGDRNPCDAQAVLYDTTVGAVQSRLYGHTAALTALAFAPAGTQLLTASQDKSVRKYDLAAGDTVGTLSAGATSAVTCIALTPDGTRYAYGTETGMVTVRDTATTTVVFQFTDHTGAVNAVAFSQDGARMASAGDDARTIVRDAASGALLKTLDISSDAQAHQTAVTAVAFSPVNANLLVTGSIDQTAKLWRVDQGNVLTTFSGGHTAAVNAVAFSPDGQFVLTGGADAKTQLWNILGIPATIQRTFLGHTGAVTSVAFSPDGTQALNGSADGTAQLMDIATGDTLLTLTPCPAALGASVASPISGVAFSSDGTRVALALAAENSIQLDTDPPTGNDMNLTVPTALSLATLTAAQYPGTYYLWAEVDTNQTEPERAYAAAQISVIDPFTTTPSFDTPRVPLVDGSAAIVVAPTTNRQIFDLGPLGRGDRMFLSLLTVPGYGQAYTAPAFSLMILDADEQMYAWYQTGYILFSSQAKLIIGHDSPNYYVVVDGCRPNECSGINLGQSVSVRIQPNVGVVGRQQRIFLNFAGGNNITVDDLIPFDIPPFLASDLNPAWVDTPALNYTQLLKNIIADRVREVYSDYNAVVSTSDDPLPELPYVTVHFGGYSTTFYGLSAYIDPRDETRHGEAVVTTLTIAMDYPTLTVDEMGLFIGNVAAHEAGHMVGLRHTEGVASDIMNTFSNSLDPTIGFTIAPLSPFEQYNRATGQIGIQNAPQLLDETIGPPP